MFLRCSCRHTSPHTRLDRHSTSPSPLHLKCPLDLRQVHSDLQQISSQIYPPIHQFGHLSDAKKKLKERLLKGESYFTLYIHIPSSTAVSMEYQCLRANASHIKGWEAWLDFKLNRQRNIFYSNVEKRALNSLWML